MRMSRWMRGVSLRERQTNTERCEVGTSLHPQSPTHVESIVECSEKTEVVWIVECKSDNYCIKACSK